MSACPGCGHTSCGMACQCDCGSARLIGNLRSRIAELESALRECVESQPWRSENPVLVSALDRARALVKP